MVTRRRRGARRGAIVREPGRHVPARGQADEFAKQNVTDLPADGIDALNEIVGCKSTSDDVTVHYQDSTATSSPRSCPATAGRARSLPPPPPRGAARWRLRGPIVFRRTTCRAPARCPTASRSATMPFCTTTRTPWAPRTGSSSGQWNVPAAENCGTPVPAPGRTGSRTATGPPLANEAPPGSAPTYVCNDTGHSTRDWSDCSTEKFRPRCSRSTMHGPPRQDRLGRALSETPTSTTSSGSPRC